MIFICITVSAYYSLHWKSRKLKTLKIAFNTEIETL